MRGRVGELKETNVSGERLLELPVRLHGINLGHPVEILVDPVRARAVALEVHCGDDRRRFLPLAAASVGKDEISVNSPLHLADEQDGAFYRERTSRLATLRGSPVARDGRAVGALRDVVLAPGGRIAELLVETANGVVSVACGDGVQVGSALLRC
jgi:hypothetical protein